MINLSQVELLTAHEAAGRLGIKLDTLYAYVSRGRIRSVRLPGGRERRYPATDIEALRRAEVPPEPLPLVGSATCEAANGRLYYRGQDAVALSERATLEEVAQLLWQSFPDGALVAVPAAAPTEAPLLERCQIRLAALAAADVAGSDLTRSGAVRTARVILHEVAACAAGPAAAEGPVHRGLAAGWELDAAGADLLRRCLVLIADHELDAAGFVARIVASTGATPYAVVGAALAALSGPRHGGGPARAEALFDELGRSGMPMVAVMAGRLVRGEDVPGFGHDLYPAGDPRAAAILAGLAQARPETGALVQTAVDAGIRLTGQRPNVDFALAAAAAGLRLRPGAGLALFVVGRTVGWIAQAIEQYDSGVLIRPRARYIGVRSEDAD
jgi:citrate synthase